MDTAGRWAASGQVDAALLQTMLAEAFLAQPPPKSTGRDLFSQSWLDAHLAGRSTRAVDVQATLAELRARAARDALRRHLPGVQSLTVGGGGAFNDHLMHRLAVLLPGVAVRTSAALGLPPDQVEAGAFAWLARAFCTRRSGNHVTVTGARGPRVLGALYPAGGPLR